MFAKYLKLIIMKNNLIGFISATIGISTNNMLIMFFCLAVALLIIFKSKSHE